MARKKPKGYYGTRKHGRSGKYQRYRDQGRREINKAREAAAKAKAYARRKRVRDACAPGSAAKVEDSVPAV